MVEDSLIILERIFSLLDELEKVKLVVHTANYKESLKMIENVNVVMLDINLPGKSGIEILKKLKSMHPAIKVIILTNHANENYREMCLKIGANHFLDKAIEFNKITEVLEDLRIEG